MRSSLDVKFPTEPQGTIENRVGSNSPVLGKKTGTLQPINKPRRPPRRATVKMQDLASSPLAWKTRSRPRTRRASGPDLGHVTPSVQELTWATMKARTCSRPPPTRPPTSRTITTQQRTKWDRTWCRVGGAPHPLTLQILQQQLSVPHDADHYEMPDATLQ